VPGGASAHRFPGCVPSALRASSCVHSGSSTSSSVTRSCTSLCTSRHSSFPVVAHVLGRVFAAYLANLLVWVLAPTDMIDLPVVFSEAFSCVMCSHMLLNMHTSLDSSRPDVDSHGMQGASIALQETSRGRSRTPGLDTLDLAVPQFIRVGPDDLERVSPASAKSGYFEERQDVF
jgi:hypothetical protein